MFMHLAAVGKWTVEEEERLKAAVTEYMTSSGSDKFDTMPWTTIAKDVKTRSWNQCQRHWLVFYF